MYGNDTFAVEGETLSFVVKYGAETPIVAVESVTLSKSSHTMDVGQTVGLSATILPENATDKSGIWNSTHPAIASVDQSGLVTGVGAGTAVITFTSTNGGKIGSCAVTIETPDTEPPTIESVNRSTSSWTNGNVILTIVASDAGVGLHAQPYLYNNGSRTSSNTCTVMENGEVIIKVRDKHENTATRTETVSNIDKGLPTGSA